MTQETEFLAAKGALGGLDEEPLLPQDGHDLPYVAEMLLQ
jgi:hypothetical protein